MRAIRTFLLRLLANPAEPGALRGDLRPMPEGDPLPFADEGALLVLLRQIVAESTKPPEKTGEETP